MASGGPSMYHPWPSMEFAMTTYKLDPLVARPGPSMAMDGMPWSLSTGTQYVRVEIEKDDIVDFMKESVRWKLDIFLL